MKKILFVGEASFLSTGFSTLQYEILKRLHATSKYEIAEYSNYGKADDPRRQSLPWAFYSSMPDNPEEEEIYRSHPLNEFGGYKFEKVVLHFKPDIVVSMLDYWMMGHLFNSPARPFYRLAIQPTCDAEPQKEEWIEAYCRSDSCTTYSEWAFNLLKEQSGGRIPLRGVTSPAADYDVFKPVPNKAQHKLSCGMDANSIILGTVMRNQSRKLYCNLLQDFRAYLDEYGGNNVYLYLHTSPIDVGWNIPTLIQQFGLSGKVLMTYVCRACRAIYPNFYQDIHTHCSFCGEYSATPPTSQNGISREALAMVMNLFDVYIQYSNSEGWGMPILEALAAQVPAMVVNYSAMEDFVKLGAIPIEPITLIYEKDTGCKRAIPDGKDFIKKLHELVVMPNSARQSLGNKLRSRVLAKYSWDKVVADYMAIFDGLPPALPYTSPAQLHSINLNPPNGLSKEDLVQWGIINIAGRPDLLGTHLHMRMLRDFNWGYTLAESGSAYISEHSFYNERTRFTPFGPNEIANFLVGLAQQKNGFEQARAQLCQ